MMQFHLCKNTLLASQSPVDLQRSAAPQWTLNLASLTLSSFILNEIALVKLLFILEALGDSYPCRIDCKSIIAILA